MPYKRTLSVKCAPQRHFKGSGLCHIYSRVAIIITMAVSIAVSLSSEKFKVASHVGITGRIFYIVKHVLLLLSFVIG